jgi:MFS family permease
MQARAESTRLSVWAPEWRALTIGLVLTITFAASEALAVATVLPLVAHDLHGLSLYGWVTSAFFLGTLVGLVVAGAEVDRRGPATPYAVSLTVFAVGLIVAGLAPAMWVVVAGRALQGLGAGAIPAIAYSSIGRTIPDALRPRVFALMSTAWVLPGLAGPVIAAAVASAFGWRVVFLGLPPLIAAIGIVPYRVLRAIRPADTVHVESARVVPALEIAGAAALGLGALAARSYLSIPLALAAVALGIRPLRALFPRGTLRARRGLPATVLTRGLLTFAFFGADVFVPLMLVAIRDRSPAFAGVVITSSTLSWTGAAWVQTRLIDRWGARRLVQLGLVLVAAAIAGTACVLFAGVPPELAILTWAIGGFGIGLAYAPLSLTMLREAEPGQEGTATSALQLSDNLGVAFGAGIGGAAVAIGAAHEREALGIGVAFAIAGAVALLGAAVASRLPGEPK